MYAVKSVLRKEMGRAIRGLGHKVDALVVVAEGGVVVIVQFKAGAVIQVEAGSRDYCGRHGQSNHNSREIVCFTAAHRL